MYTALYDTLTGDLIDLQHDDVTLDHIRMWVTLIWSPAQTDPRRLFVAWSDDLEVFSVFASMCGTLPTSLLCERIRQRVLLMHGGAQAEKPAAACAPGPGA
jgi:hypothetical protein